MAMEVDIAIVGGGLGGLALALGLQERGIRAHVFEKAPKVRKRNGTSISLHMNGLRALEGIKPGLITRLMTKGAQVTKISGIHRTHGEPERVTRRSIAPGSTCAIPWKSAHETLADAILNQSLLHWRHAFVNYNVIEGGVEARFEVLPEEESVDPSPLHTQMVRAKLLVGVDGIKSQVRKIMVGDEPRDLFAITWNAVVPTVSSLNLHEEGECRFFTYSDANSVKTVFLNDAGSKLTLWQVRTLDVSGEITKTYPLELEAHGRDVRKIRALRQVEGLEWIENLREVIEATNSDSVRESRQFDRLPLTSWSDSSKRVVLLGDAAHGMYPGPAQGARTAFEDAHQLAMLLHEALTSSAPEGAISEAVTRYQEVRIARTNRIQAYAAEKTGLSDFIPEWVRNLPPEEQQKREQEFQQWTLQYPEAISGDPNSTYWKP
ncbi:hypothetical protein M758_5G193000 [Ceratodon purpureus]|uniref:FAD-binding domain-containing protein n=1 Tax=Ceratodon purpureus TaxID=3225 RepID=A0A8T0I690_CERPU|nr:hypothetical protein KC19_5G200100 [Ceratodon purpureus]KAG0617487.1 hypothetical protein M758_5G193000 [Ceratodon purpureus]KAG0617488.1 hypothetical protein M758_5G193000 [Ceratodon purpureus]